MHCSCTGVPVNCTSKATPPYGCGYSSSCLCIDGYTLVWWIYCICTESLYTSKTIPSSKIIVLFFLAINFWAHFYLVSLDCNNITILVTFRLEPHLITGIQEYLHLLVILWRIFNFTIWHHLLSIISVYVLSSQEVYPIQSLTEYLLLN